MENYRQALPRRGPSFTDLEVERNFDVLFIVDDSGSTSALQVKHNYSRDKCNRWMALDGRKLVRDIAQSALDLNIGSVSLGFLDSPSDDQNRGIQVCAYNYFATPDSLFTGR